MDVERAYFMKEKYDRHRKVTREDVAGAGKEWNVSEEAVSVKSIRISKKGDAA